MKTQQQLKIRIEELTKEASAQECELKRKKSDKETTFVFAFLPEIPRNKSYRRLREKTS